MPSAMEVSEVLNNLLSKIFPALPSLLPAIFFWASFSFSPGPFWASWMNYHAQKNSWGIFRPYLLYLFLIFTNVNLAICYSVLKLDSIGTSYLRVLYFIGSGFIIYLAIKSFYLHLKKLEINFTFWNMTGITLTNPKVYLTIPAGSLSMLKVDYSPLVSSFIFSYIVMPPIMLMGAFFFMSLAKLGEKILFNKMRYLTSGLLLIYGIFLLYEGIIL